MYGRLCFLLIVLTFCSIVAEEIDPPIPCNNDEFCANYTNNALKPAVCENGYCLCNYDGNIKNCSGISVMRENHKASGTAPFYQSCKLDQDCKLKNWVCNTTTLKCECHKNYVLSSIDKKKCLEKAPQVDFPCTEDTQCLFLSNTTCRDGQCSCILGYHSVKNVCYKTIDIGEPCTQYEECAHADGANCTDGICACPKATTISKDRTECLPVAREILANCVEDAQCVKTLENTRCLNGSCRCREAYHFELEFRRCFADRKLGENCGNTYECYQEQEEDSWRKPLECVYNACVCAEGYRIEQDKCVNAGSRFFAPVLTTLVFLVSFVRIL
ncbi:prion-like-(Q/N-rich) domain-bearing protein 25 [Ceratina calcarata]|uniref:Prion-like-(Q/N-rich) domain-bearing protein 25 n=1 Tax=Ceratina calcarata TaxID=156304 RepID=A0AAJ7IRV6_9HYME|nr:prion-like-(Q/N-rich) domain-bearing protein 25 [Ceratina calcarata]